MATAMIVISFAQMFWDAGVGKTLIQINENYEDAAHVVFWTSVLMSIFIYLILFLAAPWLAIFFNSPNSATVLQVLGLQIVIASLSTTQQALLTRDFDFRRLFWIKMATAFISGLFSIPLALYGHGVWALVAGTLSGQILNLILLWYYSAWQPKMFYNIKIARKILRFGIWVFAESFGGWLIIWGDSLIVGHFLGVHDLGIYRTGWMLVTIIFGLVLNPLLPKIYSALSRLQDDQPNLIGVFNKTNRIIMALAFPIGFGLLVTGSYIATVFFGTKWQEIGFTIQIIGLTYAFSWMVSLNHELYRRMGKPDVNSKIIFIFILYYLPSYFVAAQYGLDIFLYTSFALCLSTIPFHAIVCMHILKISFFCLWTTGKKLIFSSVIMSIIVFFLDCSISFLFPNTSAIIRLAFMIFVGAFSYIGLLFIWEKSFVLRITHLIREAILA
jgi:PST family polysaccharide transporter